jgi:hypothetical protein
MSMGDVPVEDSRSEAIAIQVPWEQAELAGGYNVRVRSGQKHSCIGQQGYGVGFLNIKGFEEGCDPQNALKVLFLNIVIVFIFTTT